MRYLLTISLLTFVIILQSCDERITPDKVNIETIDQPTQFELLTAQSWKYNEVILKGGGQTITQFSRPNSTTSISEISTQKDTYKVDNTFESTSNARNRKGTWKFSTDEKQIILKDDKGTIRTFDIVNISKVKFEFTEKITKASVGDNELWAELLKQIGLSATTTEFITTYSLIPF